MSYKMGNSGRSGANARTGDTVRNLTTRRVGIVTGSSQFGRITVRILTAGAETYGATERWERWDVEIMAERPE